MDRRGWPPSWRARSRRCCVTTRARCSTPCTATSRISWSDQLRGMDRLRFVINAFTRMRFCGRDGTRGSQGEGRARRAARRAFCPGSTCPDAASREVRVICGHWSTLGLQAPTLTCWRWIPGCVWGGSLTAVEPGRGRAAGSSYACNEPSGAGRRRGLRRLMLGGRDDVLAPGLSRRLSLRSRLRHFRRRDEPGCGFHSVAASANCRHRAPRNVDSCRSSA